MKIRRVQDIASAFEALKAGTNGLYIFGDPLTYTNRAPAILLQIAYSPDENQDFVDRKECSWALTCARRGPAP